MAWSKTLPADNSKFGVSPGYLRTNWDALEDTIGTDHYYMGQTNDGKHKYCSFVEQSSAPTTAASVGAVYTKDSGTQPELFYREESNGDEVQITTNGVLNATTLVAASGTDLAITAASGQDILVTMGDNAAANKVSFLDSDSSEVAYIDSDGDASFDGDVAVGGDVTVTGTISSGGVVLGDWTLLETGSVSAGAVEFTDSGIGDAHEIMVQWNSVTCSGSAAFIAYFSIDGGSNYNRTIAPYNVYGSTPTITTTRATSMTITGLNSTTTFQGYIIIQNAGILRPFIGIGTNNNNNGGTFYSLNGVIETSSDINAIKLYSSTLTGGTFKLYVR